MKLLNTESHFHSDLYQSFTSSFLIFFNEIVYFCNNLTKNVYLKFDYNQTKKLSLALALDCFYKLTAFLKNQSYLFSSVKKGYHKVSLRVHPDRVSPEEKEEATKKFQALGRVYSILSDENKRGVYDETGMNIYLVSLLIINCS